jgi:hypothetical protein
MNKHILILYMVLLLQAILLHLVSLVCPLSLEHFFADTTKSCAQLFIYHISCILQQFQWLRFRDSVLRVSWDFLNCVFLFFITFSAEASWHVSLGTIFFGGKMFPKQGIMHHGSYIFWRIWPNIPLHLLFTATEISDRYWCHLLLKSVFPYL